MQIHVFPLYARYKAGLTLLCHSSIGPNYKQGVGDGGGMKKRKRG